MSPEIDEPNAKKVIKGWLGRDAEVLHAKVKEPRVSEPNIIAN